MTNPFLGRVVSVFWRKPLIVLMALLLIVLADVAMRSSMPTLTVSDIRLSPRSFDLRNVVLHGTMGKHLGDGKVSNNSFIFLMGNDIMLVRSQGIKLMPEGTRVRLEGRYLMERSPPFVAEHVELSQIAVQPFRWWFDELDSKTRVNLTGRR